MNATWTRVVATKEDEAMKKRRLANASTLKSPVFNDVCVALDIATTRRQASKFNNKRGLAYKFIKLN